MQLPGQVQCVSLGVEVESSPGLVLSGYPKSCPTGMIPSQSQQPPPPPAITTPGNPATISLCPRMQVAS